jgi:hypothetical protein
MRQRHFLALDTDEDMARGACHAASRAQAGTVRGWNRVALEAIRSVRPGAAVAARALAILHTCMYNAWAAYDDTARQTAQGLAVRLPRAERDAASKAGAMGHAARLALVQAFPSRRTAIDGHLAGLGPDPAVLPAALPAAFSPALPAPLTPAGIGRSQATAMFESCRQDGNPAASFVVLDQRFVALRQPPAGMAAPSASLPGDWCRAAAHLSARAGYGDDQDVRLFFALANALADAGMASWDDSDVCSAAAAEVLRRFMGDGSDRGIHRPGERATNGQRELGRQIGRMVFDKASRHWRGKP